MVKAVKYLLLASLVSTTPGLYAADWSGKAEVRRREGVVVSYRARLDGNILVIEATHKPGWHTYAMDNVERVRKKTGKAKPETELPTRVELSGGLKAIGKWFQSKPKDLSQPDIRWYTWGFEGTTRFAVKVERVRGRNATITINGQACNATSCSMIDDVTLSLPLAPEKQLELAVPNTTVDFSKLVEVTTMRQNPK
jgi:hypothetical protein